MRPAAPRRRTTLREAPPSREPREGDLVCATCKEANDPERKFCSRCGSSLAEAVVHVPPVPWYRRWFEAVRRVVLWRPQDGAKRRRHRWVGVVNFLRVTRSGISLLIVIALLAYMAIPPFRRTVNSRAAAARTSVQRFMSPTFNPVHALTATPSSQLPDHPASAAIDGFKNTYWAADITHDPQPTLLLSFARPVTIDVMLFTPGASGSFTSEPRPMKVHLTMSNGSGQDITLSDTASPQQESVDHGANITQLEIRIVSVYPSSQGSAVSLTEVEMFTRQ